MKNVRERFQREARAVAALPAGADPRPEQIRTDALTFETLRHHAAVEPLLGPQHNAKPASRGLS